MNNNKKMLPIEDEMLETVSGGVAGPGRTMTCTVNAPLYDANPVGNHFRSTAAIEDTVTAGTPVKIFEYSPKFCKVIANGKVGWVETALLADV